MSIRPHSFSVTLLMVMLAGCATAPVPRSGSIAAELEPTPPTPGTAQRIEQHDDESPIQIKTDDKTHGHTKAEVQPGSGKFIDEQVARMAIASPPAAEGQITFNFENQPIQAVVQAILGSLLKENYTIAPSVTGNVTFSTSKPITPEQAMPILQMLLSWTNNTMVQKEGRYEVVPVKDAIPGNLTPRIAPPNIAKGYEVRVFPLKYIAATEMQKLLKPYAKAEAVVSADNARNMIVMAGTAAELANYQRSIDVFDVDWLKGMSVGVYSLRNMEVAKMMPELDKIFGATGESPLAGMFRFIPMETTNSIVVITPQKDYLKQAETWLYRLDIGVGENGTQLYVYDVKNVKAVELSDHLNAIYTGRTSTKSSSSGNVAPGLKATSIGGFNAGAGGMSGTNYPGQQQNKSLAAGANTGASNVSTTGTGTPNAAAGGKESDIRITPIEENNQLLIMATPGEWDSIMSAIHRLDISPLQVQIEAKILEVTLSGDLQYGVQWWLAGLIGSSTGSAEANGNYNYNYPPGSTTTPNFTGNSHDRHRASLGVNGTAGPIANGGLFYSFLNKNFEVALNALQTNGNTKILSTPTLVVLNNQEAQITVGDQVPVISTSIVGVNSGVATNGTSNNAVSNTGIGQASYISTGVTLDIKPRVNPGGLVYMEVSQEDSSPSATVGASGNPQISQRNLQTQVAVQSGETVLLGGMIKETDIDQKTGLPLLSNIPIIGSLFGNTSKTHSRTELIVLITPRVITNSDDARQMTQEYEQKFESLVPLRAKEAAAHPAAVPAPQPPKRERLVPEQPKTNENGTHEEGSGEK